LDAVSDQRGQGAPTPGWYADPTGLAGVRWWDGGQWTAHTAPLPASAPGAPGAQRPPIPDTTPVYTPFIWLIILMPLLSSAAIWFYQPSFSTVSIGGVRTVDPASIYSVGYFVLLGVGLVVYALSIVFAFLDHRALRAAGVVRPFHWAWEFLSPIVYVIGRSVVVRSVAKPRGLLPIWILIAVTVVNFVVSIAWSVVLFANIAANLPSVSGV
jgi:hypothetical protein